MRYCSSSNLSNINNFRRDKFEHQAWLAHRPNLSTMLALARPALIRMSHEPSRNTGQHCETKTEKDARQHKKAKPLTSDRPQEPSVPQSDQEEGASRSSFGGTVASLFPSYSANSAPSLFGDGSGISGSTFAETSASKCALPGAAEDVSAESG